MAVPPTLMASLLGPKSWGLQGILASQAGSVFGTIAEPALLAARYATYSFAPLILPPPEAIFQAASRGYIDRGTAEILLRAQGIRAYTGLLSDPVRAAGAAGLVWNAIGDMAYSKPSPEAVLSAIMHRRIDPALGRNLFKAVGGDGVAWGHMVDAFRTYPGVGEYMTARSRNIIGEQHMLRGLERNAAELCHWFPFRDLYVNWLSLSDLIAAYHRGLADEDEWKRGLDRLGYTDDAQRTMIEELRFAIPPYSDLTQFAVKDVFNADLAVQFGLYDDFPEGLRKYFRMQGYGGKVEVPAGEVQPPFEIEWADAIWAAHWRNLARTDSEKIMYLLRPDRVDYWNQQLLDFTGQPGNLQAYGISEHRDQLKLLDYNARNRQYLPVIAFKRMRQIDARDLFEAGERDEKWYRDQLMDRGLSPDDAKSLRDLVLAKQKVISKRRIASYAGQAVTQLVGSLIGEYELGFRPKEEIDQALQALGMDDSVTSTLLNVADYRVRRKLVMDCVNVVRKRFLNGELDRDGAIGELRELGLVQERAEQRLACWSMERSRERKQITTAKIQRYLAEGMIDANEAIRRLTNLGWSNPDQKLLIDEANASAVKARQRLVAVADREAKAKEAAIAKAQRDLAAQQRRLEAERARITPPSKLQEWLKRGIMTLVDVEGRLESMGWPKAWVDEWTTEALIEQTEDQARAAKAIAAEQRRIAAEIERVRREGESRIRQLQNTLAKHTPPTKLQAMLKKGIISPEQFRERLLAMGWEVNWIDEWEREALWQKQEPPPPGG